MVTPAVFARYRTAADYAAADRAELEELIKPTGFFRNKATSLIGLGQALVERFDGELPGTLAELVTLPGFGRKTANVVLGNAFGVPGITVDTHFGRLVRRWGLTERPTRSRSSTRSARCCRPREWTMFSAPGDLPRPAGLRGEEAGLRGVLPGPAVPVLRDRAHRPARLAANWWSGAERDHLLALAGLPVTRSMDRRPEPPRRRAAEDVPDEAAARPRPPRVALGWSTGDQCRAVAAAADPAQPRRTRCPACSTGRPRRHEGGRRQSRC